MIPIRMIELAWAYRRTFFLTFFGMLNQRWDLVRLDVLEAGPAAIKTCQWLSERDDIFPEDFISEMKKLTDQVPSHPFAHTLRCLNESGIILESLNSTPVASGSIAQVHAGVYQGKRVAVKIKHPNIERRMIDDMNIYMLMMKAVPLLQPDFYKKYLLDQLNFTQEQEYAQAFAKNFASHSQIIVPKMYLAKKDVLIMEYLDGVSLDLFTQQYPERRKEALLLKGGMLCQMTLHDGLIHGDLHGGNLKFRVRDGQTEMVVLDYGVMLNYSPAEVKSIQNFVNSVCLKDYTGMCDWFEANAVKFKRPPDTPAERARFDDLMKGDFRSSMRNSMIAMATDKQRMVLNVRSFMWMQALLCCSKEFVEVGDDTERLVRRSRGFRKSKPMLTSLGRLARLVKEGYEGGQTQPV